MGEADCGEATKYADGRVIDYLGISPSLINAEGADSLYALIAKGSSMNRAKVAGKEIRDGDYVIVKKDTSHKPQDGDIVVSIIGGLANIKRFLWDEPNGRIALLPDSHSQDEFAPIFISKNDDFQIDGVVVDVVKGMNP